MSDLAKISILMVDDEQMNLDLMEHMLSKLGYQITSVNSGEAAWNYLQANPDKVNLVLLDRMMPGMDGMEVLARIHKHPLLRDLPVVMQTAAVGAKEIEMGIAQGAYYYLTKPFREEMLVSVVNSASEAARYRLVLKQHIQDSIDRYASKESGHYQARTFEDIQALSSVLSTFFPQPQNASIVLYELLLNAFEHGSLNIGYDKKKQLVNQNIWREELDKRQQLTESQDKVVDVSLHKADQMLTLTIQDQGNGFDWSNWVNFDPHRMTEANGRGIAKAFIMGMSEIRYEDSGRRVVVKALFPPVVAEET